jgi:hypothetical protein
VDETVGAGKGVDETVGAGKGAETWVFLQGPLARAEVAMEQEEMGWVVVERV